MSWINRIRSATPALIANADLIHLNNAGAALMSTRVVSTLQQHIERESLIGGYESAADAAAELRKVYASTAKLLSASPSEVALSESATVSWNSIFSSIMAHQLSLGKHVVVTSQAEYASNLLMMKLWEKKGVEWIVVPNNSDDEMDVDGECGSVCVFLVFFFFFFVLPRIIFYPNPLPPNINSVKSNP